MIRKLLLTSSALALAASPAAAHDYRWDGPRYHRDGGDVLAGALLGAAAGAVIAGAVNDHSYGYPAYGYGYPPYGYSYPIYGYGFPPLGYQYPAYGYSYPSYRVSINYGYRPYRNWWGYRGW